MQLTEGGTVGKGAGVALGLVAGVAVMKRGGVGPGFLVGVGVEVGFSIGGGLVTKGSVGGVGDGFDAGLVTSGSVGGVGWPGFGMHWSPFQHCEAPQSQLSVITSRQAPFGFCADAQVSAQLFGNVTHFSHFPADGGAVTPGIVAGVGVGFPAIGLIPRVEASCCRICGWLRYTRASTPATKAKTITNNP